MKLHVILACHNRRELTVRAITSTIAAASAAGVFVDFTVFDDGSTDGTDAALKSVRARVSMLRGDGSAYWAKSMAAAESAVLARSDVGDGPNEWIVWLNDDVLVDKTALLRFSKYLESSPASRPPEAVVVGAMRDPHTSEVTYGGLAKIGRHPLGLAQVNPGVVPVRIDTFNGNLVAVPVHIARVVGGIDGGFAHAFADIDYGFRCQRLGIDVVLAPGTYGSCPRNIPPLRGSILGDWQAFTGAKGGGNFPSLRLILRKSNPRTWWAVIIVSYGLWLTRRVLRTG